LVSKEKGKERNKRKKKEKVKDLSLSLPPSLSRLRCSKRKTEPLSLERSFDEVLKLKL
jgi:hypothetical protein